MAILTRKSKIFIKAKVIFMKSCLLGHVSFIIWCILNNFIFSNAICKKGHGSLISFFQPSFFSNPSFFEKKLYFHLKSFFGIEKLKTSLILLLNSLFTSFNHLSSFFWVSFELLSTFFQPSFICNLITTITTTLASELLQ